MNEWIPPYRLLEEARETWEQHISDEHVYVTKTAGGRHLTKSRNIDAYLESNAWWEFTVDLCPVAAGHHYAVIVERYRPPDGQRLNPSDHPVVDGSRQSSVLLGVGKGSQPFENVSIAPIRSVVRLKPLEYCPRVRSEEPSRVREFGRGITKWERDAPFVASLYRSHAASVDSPGDMVESVVQVRYDIPNQEPKHSWRVDYTARLNRHPYAPVAIHYDSGDIVLHVGVMEGFDPPPQVVEAYLRPSSLEPGAIKWMRHDNPPAKQSRTGSNEP